MLIAFVIPTLNERQGLPQVLQALPIKELEREGHCCRVIVSDGGSTDGTPQWASQWGAEVLSSRAGYGRQYYYALAWLNSPYCYPAHRDDLASRADPRPDVIVTLDGDGSYPAPQALELIHMLIERDLDFISVDRFPQLQEGAMSPMHKFGNTVLSLTMELLFGTRFKDSQSGMWVLRRTLLDRVSLSAHGMAFSEEIKIEASRHGQTLEVPGTYQARIGQAKIRSFYDGLGNLGFLFLKRLGLNWQGPFTVPAILNSCSACQNK